MTKQKSDAEISAQLETAQAQLDRATDPEHRQRLEKSTRAFKANLKRGPAGRTRATEKALNSRRRPPRFSNRGQR